MGARSVELDVVGGRSVGARAELLHAPDALAAVLGWQGREPCELVGAHVVGRLKASDEEQGDEESRSADEGMNRN